ncbi:uncharacterized protein J4E79_004514 [Alternaria viburni]|uniref:uncharacterized protein n=1 Tax=Alternaria viburni TaxID=566460 RepID=UPI0020C38B59|nr:uncharacterized protein J4E79_004514 [Alternaria viburni]KAI4662225.1 hypothetical protein J4E79_004514 [Alternaria viburni]
MTGNGGPAVSLPATPRHRSGAALNELICSLERQWNIGLRLRGNGWSPNKAIPSDAADKVNALIQFLFYSAPTALEEAIEQFKGDAPSLTREERLEKLREILSRVKKGELESKGRTPRNEPPKVRATPFSGSPTDVDTDDETDQEYETPRSPSRSPSPSPSPSTRLGQTLFQASNHASLHVSKKRPSESSNHSENSQKLTKTSKGKQAVKSFNTSPIPPPQFDFKKPTLDMARSFQPVNSVSSSVNTSFNNTTFSSQETANTTNTSFTSYDGAIELQENRFSRPQLKRTSSTTIGSLDDVELDQAMLYPGSEVREKDIQQDLNEHFTQGSSGQNRSTYGSVDETGLLEASFEVEEKQTDPRVIPHDKMESSRPPAVVDNRHGQFRASSTPRFRSNGVPNGQEKSPAAVQSPSKIPHEIRDLPTQNLFVDALPPGLEHIPYHILFICERLAIDHSISILDLVSGMDIATVSSDAEAFWSFIDEHRKIPRMKLRESNRLWQAAKRDFDGFTFRGHINLSPKRTGPILNLTLLPVQSDRSCRLERMFGSDRFLYLYTPVFDFSETNRFTGERLQQICNQFQAWLLTEHHFLNRKWRVFHVEDVKKPKTARPKDMVYDKRIVLFATEGCGIEQPYSVGQMLDRFLPFHINRHQSFCKAFARIELGLSRTTSTLCFETSQIIHVDDDLATNDPEDTMYNDSDLEWQAIPDGSVMNDGCSVISVGAALAIWQLYKKTTGMKGPLPSTFQGRIGGAKGLWMISAESYTKDPEHLKHWIKINRSQWKFHPPADDLMHHHRTFEVSNFSSPPSQSELHILYIPILADRGVKKEVIASLMEERLESEREKLLHLLPDPVKVYEWVHQNGTKTQAEPDWQAALPVSLEEKLKFLLETGFVPTKFPYLARSLERFIQTKHVFQESKLRVPLAKSAYFYGIADPFGVLEPGEIQVQFSSSFVDEDTDEKYLCLRDMEALVTRQPACRRSDIQKVRTVIRPELSHLVDVVIFPCKGRFPLAGKLQGGDYDGDMFWTCWEPKLVRPFRNAPAPMTTPKPAKYGIETRTEKLEDIMNTSEPEQVDNFLSKAFEFRNNSSLLGLVTTFAEKQAYTENRIHSQILERLYDMHDLLVDASKQGYVFTQTKFDKYVANLKPRQPRYKEEMKKCASKGDSAGVEKIRKADRRVRSNHIVDYLYFDIVRAHNIETMSRVRSVLSEAIELDDALLYPIDHLAKKGSETIKQEILSLTRKLDDVNCTWNSGWHGDVSTTERLNAVVNNCYQKFQAIQPEYPDDTDIRPLLDDYLTPGSCMWDTIKASALYAQFKRPEKSSFVLKMAGRELASLKANSSEKSRAIVSCIRMNMKPKPIKAQVQYEEEEEDDFQTALEELTL